MNPFPAVLASEVICTNILLLLDTRAPGFTVPQNLPMRCPLAWPLYISTKSYRHKLSLSRSKYLKERTTTFPSGTCREKEGDKRSWGVTDSTYLSNLCALIFSLLLLLLPIKLFLPTVPQWLLTSYWANCKNEALVISAAVIFFLMRATLYPDAHSWLCAITSQFSVACFT